MTSVPFNISIHWWFKTFKKNICSYETEHSAKSHC